MSLNVSKNWFLRIGDSFKTSMNSLKVKEKIINKKTWQKLYKIFLNIFIVLIFITTMLFLIITVTTVAGYEFFGMKSYYVLSGSMDPEIPKGSLIIVKNIAFDDMEKGNIISFYSGTGDVVTHRVHDFTEGEKKLIITKGDANIRTDQQPVLPEKVIGKVIFSTKKIGSIIFNLRQPQNLVVIIGVIISLIIVIRTISTYIKYKKES